MSCDTCEYLLVLVLHVHSTCFTPTVSCCWQDLGHAFMSYLDPEASLDFQEVERVLAVVIWLSFTCQHSHQIFSTKTYGLTVRRQFGGRSCHKGLNEDPINLSLVILEMNVLHSGRCAYCLAGEITDFIFYPTRFSTLTIHFWRNLILIGFHLPSLRDQRLAGTKWGIPEYYGPVSALELQRALDVPDTGRRRRARGR